MNPDSLLKHFDQISEAPDAVPRLRRFILDLAVRGKLVPQDPNDEPASELLKRIELEKARLVKIGQIRNEMRLPPIEKEELLFDIPDDWFWTRMGNVTTYIQRGKSPKYSSGDGLPVISQKCIQWDGLHLEWAKKITPESLGSYDDSRFLREGDLLLNSTGTGTIGRVIRVDHPGKHLVCDSHVTVMRCLLVDEHFVCIWLRSDCVYGSIEERATGATNQVELTAALAKNQITPLPPLAEQHRIVTKVGELMALCDELEAAQAKRERRRDRLVATSLHGLNNGASGDELHQNASFYLNHLPRLITRPEHIHQLRRTILNLAVRGKLVPQDPNDEPAKELTKKIEDKKLKLIQSGIMRRQERFSPILKSDEVFPIQCDWLWVKLGDLALSTDYGTSQKSVNIDDGVPVLKMGDIRGGQVCLGEHMKVRRNMDDLPALFLKKLDLLYNRTNSAELVGKTGIYLGPDDKFTFASYLIRIRFALEFTNPHYVNLAMNAPFFRETQVVPHLKQQCGQANVNGTKLKNMIVPLPPLAEQHRIVEKVNGLMKLCDELEAQINNTTAARRQLLEATLHEALFDQFDLNQEAPRAG